MYQFQVFDQTFPLTAVDVKFCRPVFGLIDVLRHETLFK